MKRTRSVMKSLRAANPIPDHTTLPAVRVDSAYAKVMEGIPDGQAEDSLNAHSAPGGRLRAALVGVAVALLGIGVSLSLLTGVIGRDATAATPLPALNVAGVTYFPEEKVFVIANGSDPIALSAIIPGASKVPERVLYCPTSGWFEGPHGEMFDRTGNYALGPAESGLMRVAVEISGDQAIVDPSQTLGAPPRYVDDPSISEPPPPLGPFCADPHTEREPGFAAPSRDISTVLGVWVDGSGNPVPGVWNEVDRTVISARYFLGTCDWANALFLEVGWPLGSVATTDEDTRLFVRDPDGMFADVTSQTFDPQAEVPPDAIYSGYHRGTWELWTSPSVADSAVFLVNGRTVERWPLLPTTPQC